MNHIFISHAGPDSQWAKRLDEDLRNVGHEVRVDLRELKLGSNSIAFMNEALGDAHTVIILYSVHTRDAKWQTREIDSATWQEIDQGKIRLVVLRLDNTPVPPLLGPKIFATLNEDSYRDVFERLCSELIPSETPSRITSLAFQEGSPNPFWRLRAEYFDEIPMLLAETFSPPAAEKIGTLEEMRPCFLEGSRGTGKTMLLMSLRARNLVLRKNTKKTLRELFGFYVRLTRGAFCNAGLLATPDGRLQDVDKPTLAQITDTFSQEFFITLIESVLNELAYCKRHQHISLSNPVEAALVREVHAIIASADSNSASDLQSLLDYCAQTHRRIAEFTKRRFIYRESVIAPIATLDLDAFKRVIAVVKKLLPELASAQFVLLLDEYENLLEHQRVVINDIVKLGTPDLSTKIAKKVGTTDSSETLSGQELQELHDYNRVLLIYSVDDDREFANYRQLLGSILTKALRGSSAQPSKPEDLLPEFDGPEFPERSIVAEVQAMVGRDAWRALTETQHEEKVNYYRHAAIFRLTYGKPGGGREKRYAGFKELAFLSSGVIRYFQEVVGMAYYLQFGTSAPDSYPVRIEPEHQKRAVYIISEHNLSALSRNVEKHGERLKYLLLDLGDCLRYKLLRHASEPEAGRLAITDPQKLTSESCVELRDFLTLGVREGVFQLGLGRPGMRPKHSSDPQPVEFNICRIFCAALQFSPRFRWKSTFACRDLVDLLSEDRRASAKKRLIDRLVRGRAEERQSRLGLDQVS
ncbi:MAG: toll/interleukin-1 receptor domain-containing protein [Betaproteobacteria bacterium]|nr:toll/interleukin-1 receptor domain-containing protein [Betaproteobacteria bacterium]